MDIRTLGYARFSVTDLDAWIEFARDVLGAMVVVDGEEGTADVRLDEQATRIRLVSGDVDRLVATGWELAGPLALAAATDELVAAGVSVEALTDDEAHAACASSRPSASPTLPVTGWSCSTARSTPPSRCRSTPTSRRS